MAEGGESLATERGVERCDMCRTQPATSTLLDCGHYFCGPCQFSLYDQNERDFACRLPHNEETGRRLEDVQRMQYPADSAEEYQQNRRVVDAFNLDSSSEAGQGNRSSRSLRRPQSMPERNLEEYVVHRLEQRLEAALQRSVSERRRSAETPGDDQNRANDSMISGGSRASSSIALSDQLSEEVSDHEEEE